MLKSDISNRQKWAAAGWIVVGLMAAFWFYYFYPAQHPFGLITTTQDKQELRESGRQLLQKFGYEADQKLFSPSLRVNGDLINRLQRDQGRNTLMRHYREASADEPLLPLYHWQVNVKKKDKQQNQDDFVIGEEEADDSQGGDAFNFRYSQRGELFYFHNEDNVLPDKVVDRPLLEELGLLATAETPGPAPSDTTLRRLMHFSLQTIPSGPPTGGADVHYDSLRARLSGGQPAGLSSAVLEQMARHHLKRFYWKPDAYEPDTLYTKMFNEVEGARIVMKRSEPLMNHDVRLELDIIPTGRLIALYANYEYTGTAAADNKSNFWDVFRFGMMLLASIAALILFYRRLKIRVVDTKSALVVALIGGLLLPLQSGLFFYGQMSLDQISSIWEYLMIFGVMVGMTGAISTLTFFILTGVGESITRQAWPGKLEVYNLMRQGLFLNKPVGYALLNGTLLALFLAGFWTLLLQLMPDVGLVVGESGSQSVFFNETIPLSPLFLLAKVGWISLVAILFAFTIIGSYIYNKTERGWVAIFSMALTLALLPLITISLTPTYMEVIASLLIALAVGICFYYREVVTSLVGLFLFLLLLEMDTAWLPTHTPDHFLLYFMGLLLAGLLGYGFFAVMRGSRERKLPDYVPEYVQELAREQRMKQELEIAKRVQQDFLPLETPDIEGWQMGAVCKPAYETGGDYYDFIQIDKNRLAVIIGDVSGKGIEAAFYMTFVKGVLHSLAHEVESPARLLKNANRLFYENAPRGTFISLVFGIIDLERGMLRYARAGHNPILFKSVDNDEFQTLKPSGIGLGMDSGDTFDQTIEEKELLFKSGDMLILYTDGMVEAVNARREFFGYERFLDTFQSAGHISVDQIIQHTTDRLEQFIGRSEQHDDMTMIVIRKT